MSEIEKVLKDVVYGSVGAVATALEVGAGLAKTFVEKGQEAVRQGQERAEEVKQAMKDACESIMKDPGIDLSGLTRAQRDELRRQLDELDAAEDAACCRQDDEAECDCEPCEEEEDCACGCADEDKSADCGVTYETGSDDEEK